jgi:hypothetical protein
MAYSASSKIVLAIASTTLSLVTVNLAPAQAAKLNFSFTTQNGSTGSFILDTEITPSPEPALFFLGNGSVAEGIGYLDAVSDFSVSIFGTEISRSTGDFVVYPTLTAPGGFPIFSSVQTPAGCSVSPTVPCSLNVDVVFSGDPAALPELPSNPEAYSPLGLIGDILPNGDFIVSSSVTVIPDEPAAVPESSSALGLLALGLIGMGWSLKRKVSTRSFR